MEKAIEPVELVPLSDKHQRVLDQYLLCWNQTKAYMGVYVDITYESAKSASARLFAAGNFQGHLQLRLAELHMSAEEAFKLTTDIARGDLTQVLEPSGDGFIMDMAKIKENGYGRLVKKLKQRTTKRKDGESETVFEFELYDAQTAQRDILKMRGKFPGNSQRENAAPPGAVVAQPAALMELVDLIERSKQRAVDQARADDGILHEEKQV